MTGNPYGPVSVSRAIRAPASELFGIVTVPSNHPLLDGSDMVKGASFDGHVSGVGDVFTMRMHNGEMGDYEMANHVVEYETDRRIVWEPVLAAASRAEDVDGIGDRAHHRWGFKFVATDDGTTLVTETFDCTRSPEWLRTAVKGGRRWLAAMTATLEKLEDLARA